ncbi:MAG: cation:proton antiporter [Lysobacteraceae bacterium]
MPHDVSLIAMLAAAFGGALVLGYLAHRVGLPAIVGFLAAGVLIGPHTPGYVADAKLAMQLAEIGVMLLMFGVGLHFSLDDLKSVRRIALPGALLQIGVAVAMGMGLAAWWGWSPGAGFVFGMCLSVASTVVLLKALEARGLLDGGDGKIAVGWLVVEDLVMVLVLVLLPVLAPLLAADGPGDGIPEGLWATLGTTLLKVAAFFVVMLVVGRRLLPRLLWWVARTGNRELFTLAVMSAAIGVAFGAAALFSVSFALGAFFAGMMMRESAFSHRAAEESLPFRDAFAVLFFVSVGMLFDPAVVVEAPGKLLAVVGVIIVGKTIAAILLVRLLRYPWRTALTVGVSLAQIGEFSFILAGLGLALGLVDATVMSLVVAGAVISIALNGALFSLAERLKPRLAARDGAATGPEQDLADPLAVLPDAVPAQSLRGHVVIVGHGRVGAQLGDELAAAGRAHVVVDSDRARVEALRGNGRAAVLGDATRPEVLVQAHVQHAAALVVATPDMLAARAIAQTARQLRPAPRVLVRTHSAEEAELLERQQLGEVFYGERELALGLARRLLEAPANDAGGA